MAKFNYYRGYDFNLYWINAEDDRLLDLYIYKNIMSIRVEIPNLIYEIDLGYEKIDLKCPSNYSSTKIRKLILGVLDG